MELYIQVKDGKPFEHPIVADNFRQAFPHIDTNNLPPEFARFVRVQPPAIGLFEVCPECVYELVDGVYTDIHNVRPMTAEEKAAKIAEAKANLPNPTWRIDEETLRPILPLMPTTGGPWTFDHTARDWVIATAPPFPSWTLSEDGFRYLPPVKKPQDGSKYRWDEPTLSWIQLNA